MRIFSKKSRAGSTRTDREIVKPEERKYISERIELNLDVQKQKQIDEAKKMIARQLALQKGLPNRAKAMEPFDKNATFFNERIGELNNFKRQGGKVVGTLCVFAPPELILGAGGQPIRLCSGFHEPVFAANELLGDVGLCPLVRSVLGVKIAASNPYFDGRKSLLSDRVRHPGQPDGLFRRTH